MSQLEEWKKERVGQGAGGEGESEKRGECKSDWNEGKVERTSETRGGRVRGNSLGRAERKM